MVTRHVYSPLPPGACQTFTFWPSRSSYLLRHRANPMMILTGQKKIVAFPRPSSFAPARRKSDFKSLAMNDLGRPCLAQVSLRSDPRLQRYYCLCFALYCPLLLPSTPQEVSACRLGKMAFHSSGKLSGGGTAFTLLPCCFVVKIQSSS